MYASRVLDAAADERIDDAATSEDGAAIHCSMPMLYLLFQKKIQCWLSLRIHANADAPRLARCQEAKLVSN